MVYKILGHSHCAPLTKSMRGWGCKGEGGGEMHGATRLLFLGMSVGEKFSMWH